VIRIDDDNFEQTVRTKPQTWLIFFGAEWSPQSQERKRWFEASAATIPAGMGAGYAEINTASRPAHYCGIICVPTIVLWKNGKVVDQLIEFFDRTEFDSKLRSWFS
jgi:thioredoxin-like negative regulator of GroEL